METKLGKVFVLVILFLLGAPWLSVIGKKRSKSVYCCLLAAVCSAVCCITLISRSFRPDRIVLLVPFFTYSEAYNAFPLNLAPYLKDGELTLREMLLAFSYSYQYIGLNILMFVPFGYLLKKLYEHKKCTWIILHGFVFSLLIECIQYTLYLGWFDIDDIINNTVGTYLGCISCLKLDFLITNMQRIFAGKDQKSRDG